MDSTHAMPGADLITRRRDYQRRYRAKHRERIRKRQQARRARTGCYDLGYRQRQIVLLAWDCAQAGEAVLHQHDIFTQLYGWTPPSQSWGTRFNPVEIGVATYRMATGHVSRSITQLCKRGLLERGARRGHVQLTPEGAKVAHGLAAKRQAAAQIAEAAARQGCLFPEAGTRRRTATT